jgi:hypothetical protein
MPKFLIKASYHAGGRERFVARGWLGSRRRKVVGALGGKLEAFYFAFGETDVYGIYCRMP